MSETELEELDGETLVNVIEENYGSIAEFVEEEDVEYENGFKKKERPDMLHGSTRKINTPYGSLFLTVNSTDTGRPFEVFGQMGKAGGFTESMTEAICRLISTSLRAGVDPEEIIGQLEGIRSPQVSWDEGDKIQSIPDAMATGMKRSVNRSSYQEVDVQTVDTESEPDDTDMDSDVEQVVQSGSNPECPECNGMLVMEEGCNKCPECGFSKCG